MNQKINTQLHLEDWAVASVASPPQTQNVKLPELTGQKVEGRKKIGRPMADLAGRKFGLLTVIKLYESKSKNSKWLCECACGNFVVRTAGNIVRPHVQSCGCYKFITHGHAMNGTTSPEYVCWNAMMLRCYNPRHISYARYGGRGIVVCERWHSFQNFLEDMGLKNHPRDSIDRINNNGNYEHGNCRWATASEQANNRSNNRFLTHNGETHTLAQWAVMLGVPSQRILARIRLGWSDEKALSCPKLLNQHTTFSLKPSVRL